MSKKCQSCGLFNTDEALQCECGYVFSLENVVEENNRQKSSEEKKQKRKSIKKYLFSISIKPRTTIRKILEVNSQKVSIILATLLGISWILRLGLLFHFITPFIINPIFSYLFVIFDIFLLGFATGFIYVYYGGRLLFWTGSWFGGKAKLSELRTVLAWAAVPQGVVAVGMLIKGFSMYSSQLFWMDIVVWISVIWSFFILLRCIQEVQCFSLWTTLESLFFSSVLFCSPILLYKLYTIIVIYVFLKGNISSEDTFIIGEIFPLINLIYLGICIVFLLKIPLVIKRIRAAKTKGRIFFLIILHLFLIIRVYLAHNLLETRGQELSTYFFKDTCYATDDEAFIKKGKVSERLARKQYILHGKFLQYEGIAGGKVIFQPSSEDIFYRKQYLTFKRWLTWEKRIAALFGLLGIIALVYIMWLLRERIPRFVFRIALCFIFFITYYYFSYLAAINASKKRLEPIYQEIYPRYICPSPAIYFGADGTVSFPFVWNIKYNHLYIGDKISVQVSSFGKIISFKSESGLFWKKLNCTR